MSTPSPARLTREEVLFRRAQEADRPTIEYIASKTWDGDDYLAEIFDQWLADDTGAFNVMTYRDAVVATSKLTRMGDGEWWMEGLRVHPDYQGRGLARIMHHYIVNQARQMGNNGIVRFATSSENTAVHRLANETGFQLTIDFARLYASATPQPTTWRKMETQDFDTIYQWLDANPYFQRLERSFESRWRLKIATPEVVLQALSEGRIFAWNPNIEDHAIVGVFVVNPPHPKRPEMLSFAFAYAEHSLREFWLAARGLAAALDKEQLHTKALNEPSYLTPLEQADWENETESRMLVFSRPLSLVENADVEHEEIPSLGL